MAPARRRSRARRAAACSTASCAAASSPMPARRCAEGLAAAVCALRMRRPEFSSASPPAVATSWATYADRTQIAAARPRILVLGRATSPATAPMPTRVCSASVATRPAASPMATSVPWGRWRPATPPAIAARATATAEPGAIPARIAPAGSTSSACRAALTPAASAPDRPAHRAPTAAAASPASPTRTRPTPGPTPAALRSSATRAPSTAAQRASRVAAAAPSRPIVARARHASWPPAPPEASAVLASTAGLLRLRRMPGRRRTEVRPKPARRLTEARRTPHRARVVHHRRSTRA